MKPKFYFLLLALILMSSKNSFCQWALSGNAVTGNDFLGTTNSADLNLKTQQAQNVNFYTNTNAGLTNQRITIIGTVGVNQGCLF